MIKNKHLKVIQIRFLTVIIVQKDIFISYLILAFALIADEAHP